MSFAGTTFTFNSNNFYMDKCIATNGVGGCFNLQNSMNSNLDINTGYISVYAKAKLEGGFIYYGTNGKDLSLNL